MAIYTGMKWGGPAFGSSGGVVTWSFATSQGVLLNFDASIGQARFQADIRDAFRYWDAVADIAFREVTDAAGADIRLAWSNIDGQFGILGTAGWQGYGATLLRAEINFDLSEDWGGRANFSAIALHEIGHAIGLGHVDDAASIMNAYASDQFDLAPRDVKAVQKLYGSEPEKMPASGFGLEYIASYTDLIAYFGVDAAAAEKHYWRSGREAGREVSFDGLEYIASYKDLMAHFGTDEIKATKHYIHGGHAAGRHVTFDGLEYIASYKDLMAHFGTDEVRATKHYIQGGYAAGRHVTFDGLEYIASHDDLVRHFGADSEAGTLHYIRWGYGAGRSSDGFDVEQYLARYSDLRATFGTDTEAATTHYIETGFYEGRTDELLFTDSGDWLV